MTNLFPSKALLTKILDITSYQPHLVHMWAVYLVFTRYVVHVSLWAELIFYVKKC
jgi:hypothetical protein